VRFVQAPIHPSAAARCYIAILQAPEHSLTATDFLIHPAEDAAQLDAYRRLRRAEFVVEQGLFAGTVPRRYRRRSAHSRLGCDRARRHCVGGVSVLAPCCPVDIGWWTGSRLVTDTAARAGGIGPALVRGLRDTPSRRACCVSKPR